MLFSNRAFEQLFGYSPQDIATVEDWARLVYPDLAHRSEIFDWWSATDEQAQHGCCQVEAKVLTEGPQRVGTGKPKEGIECLSPTRCCRTCFENERRKAVIQPAKATANTSTGIGRCWSL